MAKYQQYECDSCGCKDMPVRIEVEPCIVPLPDGWAVHSIDGQPVHLCPDCAKSFSSWLHSFFECDQV